MTDTQTKTVQVGNTPTGEYDVRRPLPYPFHIDAEGNVLRQDFWRGEPAGLVGFQRDRHVQQVDLFTDDWLASDDEAPAGWFPVFMDADGGMWNHLYPVVSGDE